MGRRTVLHDWHAAHGARMVDFAGWDMPVQYTTIVEEHTAVRTAAGLFDISHMGRLHFSGPDALALIQRVYTNNAATMKMGQVRYGLVCNDQGGIRDDVLVYRWPGDYTMVVNASNREKILGWLAESRGSLKADVQDQTLGHLHDRRAGAADKLIVAAALILIVSRDPRWFLVIAAIVIIGREITVSALREWMAEIGARGKMKVTLIGKYKTIMQIVGLSLLLYREDLFMVPVYKLGIVLTGVAVVLTLWSMIVYLRLAWPDLRGSANL